MGFSVSPWAGNSAATVATAKSISTSTVMINDGYLGRGLGLGRGFGDVGRGFGDMGRGFGLGRGFGDMGRGFGLGRGFGDMGRGFGLGRGFGDMGRGLPTAGFGRGLLPGGFGRDLMGYKPSLGGVFGPNFNAGWGARSA
uniref:hypothetical protein n=1 Tax=Thiolinea disciformis TaxID=125614 RepID=UPI00037B2EB1